MNTRQNPNGKADMTALVAAARNGDQNAFTALYEAASQDVYRSARAVLRSEELALDVQQDTFIYAFSHLDQLEDPAKFPAWVRRIAVNQAKTALRKQSPVLFTELENEEGEGLPEQADLSPAASPELSLERKETARLVNEILGKLSDGQRAAVGMYYYEQMSIAEISEALGVAPSTVKNQLVRGRKKIETAVRALEKQGVKLYGLSPLPFLLALMRQAEPTAASGARLAAVKAAVTKASADAVAATAVPVAAKTFGQVLAGRLLAGVLAVALIGGGIWGGAKLLKSKPRDNPYRPTTVETNERLSGVETPEEISETNEDLPVITDPAVTEPVVTEPAETQPAATEPAVTEPSGTDPAVTEPSGTEPAQPVRADNQCGEHLTWSFNPETGWLTIAGSGPMDDYADAADTPWYSLHSEITWVELPDGLTAIGDNAFAGCTALAVAWLDSDQLCRIGAHAFDGCAISSFNLYTYNSTNDRARLEIGDYAFRGCSRISGSEICPYYVTRIGTGAFADCNMAELWIINEDCAIGAAAVDPSVTLRGLPDSAAARYAAQNANPFDPMTEISRDSVVGLLAQGESNLRYNGIIPHDSRFILNVVRADRLTATETEIQQAAQTGSIALAGKEYPYADSAEEAAEWSERFTNPYNDNDWLGVNNDEVVGWIQRYEGDYYKVMRQDDRYVFCHCSWVGEWDPYLNEYVDLGWLWLDADNPYSMPNDDPYSTGDYYKPISEVEAVYYHFDLVDCGLSLNAEGQIVPSCHDRNRK